MIRFDGSNDTDQLEN